MIWLDSLVLLPIAVIVVIVLNRVHPARRLKVALWLSFPGCFCRGPRLLSTQYPLTKILPVRRNKSLQWAG